LSLPLLLLLLLILYYVYQLPLTLHLLLFPSVEKWHFKSHVGKFCKEHCDPKDFPEVKNFNTVICEERFKWVAKFKGLSVTNMSSGTFNFLILLLCWLDHEDRASPYGTTL
jgi:hypothetical protein